MNEEIIAWLRTRLLRPLPGTDAQNALFPRIRPMPETIPADARASAVMALIALKDAESRLILIQRTADRGAHSRQISFPGGRQEDGDADLLATALRETEEEIGIAACDIVVLGALSPLYIPVSNYRVYPFLGFIGNAPEYRPAAAEVAAILEVPLSLFLDDSSRTVTEVISPVDPGVKRTVNAYRLPGDAVLWGATAMIVAELAAILEEAPKE